MTSRNWVRLFLTTLAVGGITTGILGFIIRWSEFQSYFVDFKIGSILSTFIWLIGVGLIFSVISQVGYFAYLTIHQFGLGIFRSSSLWNGVQLVLTIFALFDLIYIRFEKFAKPNESLAPYIGLAIFILVAGLIVSYFKSQQGKKSTFIPALFFMVVVTILEWIPVLRVNEKSWVYLMLFPLVFCNAYQILMLPKYLKRSEEERAITKAEKGNQNQNSTINKKKK
ncbi:KinB-signaling pathway activation protein [Heyndrickxia sp. NPDC080065]|uniref:KinB-signaling pathway activation protein n=1 Tax=Heyndrickxia sp. NPDC080065 TaxID=3390568 RepID=UPI003D092E76